MKSEFDEVLIEGAMLITNSDTMEQPPSGQGSVFPVSASLPNSAKMQEQEITAVVRELQDAKARIRALEEAATIRELDAAPGKLDEQLRTVQRELAQTKRECAVKVQVCSSRYSTAVDSLT